MSTLFDMGDIPEPETKSNEWYTPSCYIEAARSVMQGIELDPASCEMANQTVKASRYYTKEDNGLAQEWKASSVWLNPPYARTVEMKARGLSTIDLFIRKLVQEYCSGNVEQAIALVTTQLDAYWFRSVWDFTLCFSDHKVHFNMPFVRTSYSHMFGTCFVYLGPNISLFVEHFTEFGPVVTPDGVHRRPQPLPQPTLWDKEDA